MFYPPLCCKLSASHRKYTTDLKELPETYLFAFLLLFLFPVTIVTVPNFPDKTVILCGAAQRHVGLFTPWIVRNTPLPGKIIVPSAPCEKTARTCALHNNFPAWHYHAGTINRQFLVQKEFRQNRNRLLKLIKATMIKLHILQFNQNSDSDSMKMFFIKSYVDERTADDEEKFS
jgi:hypothetical protein